MALIIGPDQEYAPKKETAQSRDQLMQIVDWLYSQTDVALDIPEQGCSQRITLFTPKFNANGGWELSSNIFSWQKDFEHTEEWSVWIISSRNDTWHDYGELDSAATYDYEYVVPEGNHQSIFGFVSINSTKAGGSTNKTYGNLLDNISFKEYYYVYVNDATNNGGSDLSIVYEENAFLPDSVHSGWAFSGSDISIHLREGERAVIGAYVNNTFVPISDWDYDEETGEYIYRIENILSSMKVEMIYVANTVVYDSRNDYEYQYDGIDGGCEFTLGPSFQEYLSHAPEADDGWQFVGWKYISMVDDKVYMLDAVHKLKFVENTTDISQSTFAIYKVLSESETDLIVDNISYDEGITLSAEWKYRQRIISKTFNNSSSEYEISTEGGYAEISVISGEASDKSDYVVGLNPVGEELYSSDSTYINVSAYQQTGFTFNGWYDASGNLVSNSISYTYKVDVGEVVELYAYFEPKGYDITIHCSVEGDNDSGRYFAIYCTFSNLRENKVYTITGLSADNIAVGGATVKNPNKVKTDASGNATVTIYMKHGDSAKFVFFPQNGIYSVISDDYFDDGYNVRGEVVSQVLSAEETVDLKYYFVKQSVLIEAGKSYAGIVSDLNPDAIYITGNSSYTVDVSTQYNPTIYTDLNVSLCFFDSEGTEAAIAAGTRILMVDLTDANSPKYYKYVVPGSAVSKVQLEQFIKLGSSDLYVRDDTGGSTILERLVFLIDYVGTENSASSRRISLVYDDADNDLAKAIKPVQKIVNVETDTTRLTVTTVGEGCVANVGHFSLDITVSSSTPAVNTTYEDDMYAIKLSLNGGFPDGSYAEVGGVRYYSNNGCITLSSLASGGFTLDLYSPVPIALTDGKATLTATLLPAVSSSVPGSDVKSVTVVLNCVDAQECAIDADILNNIFTEGRVYQTDVTLRYAGIDSVFLTVSKKTGDGIYRELFGDVIVELPTVSNTVTVMLANGIDVVSGETYIFSFVGYLDDVPVCWDECYAVCGYE